MKINPSDDSFDDDVQRQPPISRKITNWIVDKLWCIAPPMFVAVSGLILYGRIELFSATGVIIGCAILALLWAGLQFLIIARIPVVSAPTNEGSALVDKGANDEATTARLIEIYEAIFDGAESFLRAEYSVCAMFVAIFSVIIFVLIGWASEWNMTRPFLTSLSFVLGAVTSMASGYLGMKFAVYSNVRTTISAQKSGWTECFNTAFRAGAVMGFALCGLGILVLYVTMLVFRPFVEQETELETWKYLTECLTGYGLGGSSIAMFGRVGGGIYTKAADVGADLVGKVVHGIPEDDPRNPATIADNVGDNVGDVAGMGSDLFGSFAEATAAALVLGCTIGGWNALVFPIIVSAFGVIVCLLCSFIATHIKPVKSEAQVEKALKMQLISTTVVMVPAVFLAADAFLPAQFSIQAVVGDKTMTLVPDDAAYCVIMGAVGGLIIGLITEYYTSHSYKPVRELADSCKTGAATNMIYGIALGYKSVIIPVLVLALVIYGSFNFGDMYGVSLAAIGFLSNLATGLTIDVYGPVCDNAGGIAEMAELDPYVREKTDALDAAGNTTAAIGKGFAIGSAALVSLALFGAFVTRIRDASGDTLFSNGVNMLEPITFAFLIIGGMIPFAFAAMTMKSVGLAAMEMVNEVQRQFDEKPHLLDANPTERPDYDACIAISTKASLREMVPPGAMVILTPLFTGIFFGVHAVCGLLVGSLIASVQLAISMSNSGGAWDNAKKYIEQASPDSDLRGKGSDIHKAAVVGDTVGDPFKDTSGPALNIVMKLMAVLSLVFADTFYAFNQGSGLLNTS